MTTILGVFRRQWSPRSQSGWRPNEDIQMSHPVSFGQLIIINSPFWTYITANCKQMPKTILQQNMAYGMGCKLVKFGHEKLWSISLYDKEAIGIIKNFCHQFFDWLNLVI